MCVAVGLAEQLDHMRKAQTCITYHSSGRDWVVCETAVERLLQFASMLSSSLVQQSLQSFVRTSDLAQLNGLLLQTIAKRQIVDDHTVDQIISSASKTSSWVRTALHVITVTCGMDVIDGSVSILLVAMRWSGVTVRRPSCAFFR